MDCVSGSGQYQLDSTLNPWNGTGPLVSVGSAPIKLCDNGFVSSSSDGDGDGDLAKQKNLLRIDGFGFCLAVICEIEGELSFCYDFDITLLSYKTVIRSTILV